MADIKFTKEELANEIWKDIPGYEGYYSASTLGRIRRDKQGWGVCKAGYIMRPYPIKKGYLRLRLSRDSQPRMWLVARLIALTFIGPLPFPKAQVNHIDGIKTNNRPTNLEYVSNRENQEHANHIINVIIPSRARGERNPRTYFSNETVLQIRKEFANGNITKTALSRRFQTTVTTISRIVNRKTWGHI